MDATICERFWKGEGYIPIMIDIIIRIDVAISMVRGASDTFSVIAVVGFMATAWIIRKQ